MPVPSCSAPRINRVRLCAASASEAPKVPTPDPTVEAPSGLLERASGAAGTVYRFSRPHTIRGTLLACFTGVARALIESPSFLALLPSLLPRAMLGVLALLLGNLFIVGINQIYDVDIDEVNKPYLPIAAGRLSPPCRLGHRARLRRDGSRDRVR